MIWWLAHLCGFCKGGNRCNEEIFLALPRTYTSGHPTPPLRGWAQASRLARLVVVHRGQFADRLSRFPLRLAQLVQALQIEPELRPRAKKVAESQRCIPGDGACPFQNLRNPVGGNADSSREFGSADAKSTYFLAEIVARGNRADHSAIGSITRYVQRTDSTLRLRRANPVPRCSVFIEQASRWEMLRTGFGAVARTQQQSGAAEDVLDWEDKPPVLRDDVDDQEVNLGRKIWDATPASKLDTQ